MAAGSHTFIIEQGTTWDSVVTWLNSSKVPYDLTGYVAKMQIRDVSQGPVIANVTPYLTLGGLAGTITFNVPASVTETWTWPQSKYDLIVIAPNLQTKRLLSGIVKITPGITE